jgi:hypothetical protein
MITTNDLPARLTSALDAMTAIRDLLLASINDDDALIALLDDPNAAIELTIDMLHDELHDAPDDFNYDDAMLDSIASLLLRRPI